MHFFNDSKATNVDATIKALEAFESGVILILGGRDKGGDFKVLSRLLLERAKSLILLGEASEKIRTQLAGTVPMTHAHGMDDAVKLAFHQAAPGNTVLLAPACASFDMFQNYEHRGREFKAAVGRLQVTGGRVTKVKCEYQTRICFPSAEPGSRVAKFVSHPVTCPL